MIFCSFSEAYRQTGGLHIILKKSLKCKIVIKILHTSDLGESKKKVGDYKITGERNQLIGYWMCYLKYEGKEEYSDRHSVWHENQSSLVN